MYGSAPPKKPPPKKPPMKKPPQAKQGKRKELTQRQKDALKRHAEHHSKKHIAMMTKLMKEGKSFSESHKMTMKKIGK